jgi:hypothetical protein
MKALIPEIMTFALGGGTAQQIHDALSGNPAAGSGSATKLDRRNVKQ